MEHDPELQNYLKTWPAPTASPDLDASMMARFQSRRRRFWQRRLEVRLSIPMPMLAAVALLLTLSGGWLAYQSWRHDDLRERMGGFELVAAPQLTVDSPEVAR